MFDDILSLRVFEKVAALRSFSKAAHVLKFSQVMISKRIAKLESQWGVRLFERSSKSVELTIDGHRLLKACHHILNTITLETQHIAASSELSGTLKLITPPFFFRPNIVPHLNEFFSRYPQLKLDIILTENHLDLIEHGAHVEIRVGNVEPTPYEQRILCVNSKVICATPDYLARHGTPTCPTDLYHHNCLIFGENRFWRLIGPNRQRYDLELTGNVRCNNGEIIKELVLSGLGITLKSRRDIETELASGALVDLFPELTIENKTMVYANYPKNVLWEPQITAFLSFLGEQLNLHSTDF